MHPANFPMNPSTVDGDGEARPMVLPMPGIGPATLPIQPVPLDVTLNQLRVSGITVSDIVRYWRPGDTRRCRLCQVCVAKHEYNLCSIMLTCAVPANAEELGLFDSRALVWAGAGQGDGSGGLDNRHGRIG